MNIIAIADGVPKHGDDNPSTVDAIPDMTDADIPSGYLATASEAYYSPWKAFDNSQGTYWYISYTTVPGHWIQIQVPEKIAVNKYLLTAQSAPSMIHDWTLQGSNTGAFSGEEVLLDSRVNISWASNYQEKTFTFENSTPFLYYRIRVDGQPTAIRIANISLVKTQGT